MPHGCSSIFSRRHRLKTRQGKASCRLSIGRLVLLQGPPPGKSKSCSVARCSSACEEYCPPLLNWVGNLANNHLEVRSLLNWRLLSRSPPTDQAATCSSCCGWMVHFL